MTDHQKHKYSADWFAHSRAHYEQFLTHLTGKPCHILEIGCFEGRGTCWLLENIATNRAARITCIDIKERKSFWRNVEASGAKTKVALKLGYS
ncbi:MAG: class I SAM-dependent methyltransferase, partial [Chthoniobacterales bacterium]